MPTTSTPSTPATTSTAASAPTTPAPSGPVTTAPRPVPTPAAAISPPRSGEVSEVVAVVPAHNEEELIAATLQSLQAQTRPADRIIVIADNCTDRTVPIARDAGADVFETVGNVHKKGGGLNQLLAELLPSLPAGGTVLVADADTTLDPRFLEVAVDAMQADAEVGAVGGIFQGDENKGGLLGQLQRNEYLRYSRQLQRTGKVWVLTGTASMFRGEVLRQVAEMRGDDEIPGQPGQVYDTDALTEDNELTLAIKTLGWRCVSPEECRVVTDVMPTWRELRQQRLRWLRGAVENLLAYGWTPVTRGYIGQQLGMALGVLAMSMFLVYLVLSVRAWTFHPFWTSLTLVFVAERTLTVRRGGWRAMLVAAPLVIEMIYDLFLQSLFVIALNQILLRRDADW